MSVRAKMTAIADQLRALMGGTDALSLDGMATTGANANAAKADIAAYITEKGVEVPEGTALDGFRALLDLIAIESGVKWEKFDCVVETTTTWTRDTNGSDVRTYFNISIANEMIWNARYFDSNRGLYGSDQAGIDFSDITSFVGKYYVKTDGTMSGKIDTCSMVAGSTTVCGVNLTSVHNATAEELTTFSQGTTSYGIATIAEGELPEEGTLIEGSADGDYCVLDVGGTYYYYVRQISESEFQSMVEEAL